MILSASQGPVPNLDGTEDHSKHIMFGTNVDLTDNIPAAVSNGDRAADAEKEGRSKLVCSKMEGLERKRWD